MYGDKAEKETIAEQLTYGKMTDESLDEILTP